MRSRKVIGSVQSVTGQVIRVLLPTASIGDLCYLYCRDGKRIPAEVVAFDKNSFILSQLEETSGIGPGSIVESYLEQLFITCSDNLLGSAVSCTGSEVERYSRPFMNEKADYSEARSIRSRAPLSSERTLIRKRIETGVKAIDAFCTLGMGQRIGVMASAGVGKSSILGMLAKYSSADVIVIALVGERGREVREFAERTIGKEGMSRVVIVAATSDEPSLARQLAPYTATTIAEYFRDQGNDVLLMIDSLTRMARATRETSLSTGELPVRHGYTNSVYTELPKLLERSGVTAQGSITAVCTVLTNEEDDVDPLADEIKSLLDGHIVLTKELANRGVFPAIDLSKSLSRLFSSINDAGYRDDAIAVIAAFTRLIKDKPLALLGGSPDPELSRIIELEQELYGLIRQDQDNSSSAVDARWAVTQFRKKLASMSFIQ